MVLSVDYTVLCCKGKVRAQNQDNFWCQGHFLGQTNAGMREPLAGTADISSHPAFAVFDGMGGESCGETAAYIAAKSFNACYTHTRLGNTEKFLVSVCDKMNKEICEYTEKRHMGHMGSTAVMLLFNGHKAYACNIGDSRIYRAAGGTLYQISQDHTSNIAHYAKPLLSQHLGIPQKEFAISPYISSFDFRDGDQYILCSDGLTDMVSDNEIERIIQGGEDVRRRAIELMDLAMASGGADNITITLCELRKKRCHMKTT